VDTAGFERRQLREATTCGWREPLTSTARYRSISHDALSPCMFARNRALTRGRMRVILDLVAIAIAIAIALRE